MRTRYGSQMVPVDIRPQLFATDGALRQLFNVDALVGRKAAIATPPEGCGLHGNSQQARSLGRSTKKVDCFGNFAHGAELYRCRGAMSTIVELPESTIVYSAQMRLGEKLPIYLAQRNWQLADLARATRMDVRTLYAMTERRTRTSRFAGVIAQAFGITVDELLEDAAPRPQHRHKVSEPHATCATADTLSPMEQQLLQLFRGCKPARRDDLLHFANTWFVEAHPGSSAANPYAVIREPPAGLAVATRKGRR